MIQIECLNCGVPIKTRKYCSQTCQKEYEESVKIKNWLAGNEVGYKGKRAQTKNFVRKYLFSTRGTACSECGWDERHPVDGAILTEIDHIDGDSHNCTEENLRILCPNCHAKTPTFRRRNKNSKRFRNL